MPDTEKNTEELLAQARKQFALDMDAEKDLRDEAERDLRFEAGDQWDERIKADRQKSGRPFLTFNRTHTFVQQVSNEARQQKPQIKYVPAEDGDEETAKIYEGLARHIQYDSSASEAYETAAECAAAGGFGYFGILPQYADDDSFDQEIKVVSIPNPFQVYGILDPICRGAEPDHCFHAEILTKAEYERQFGEDHAITDWENAVSISDGWVKEDEVRIANYYVREAVTKTVKRGDRTRVATSYKIKCYKINGVEVLEESEIPRITIIPIIPVLGKRRIVDGRPRLFSVIRFQRDPQQLINFYKTRIAETLGTAPIQPFMVARGQITPELAPQWQNLNSKLIPFLEYEPVNVNGQPAPPPQRQVFEAPIAALSAAAAQEIDDMKATTGIFDASLGSKGNETTGIAIARRQQQSDVVNMHFMDNLERAFQRGGRVLADMIPAIYDTPRIVRILGEDETAKLVKINQETENDNKEPARYNIGGDGVGKYDVIVTMGRSFSSKRMESFDMMGQILQGNPNILPMIGDLVFKNSDVAGADQMAERFKKMLPPNLQDEQQGQQQIPPQVQAQVQQMMQQHQALNEYAKQKEQELEQYKSGMIAKEMEVNSRMQIEQMHAEIEREKMKLQLAIAEINATAQNERERMKLEFSLNKELAVQEDAQAHEVAMRAAEIGHETAMAEKSHEQQKEAADIGHAHALEIQKSKPQGKEKPSGKE